MYEFDHATPVTVALRAHAGTVDVVAEDRLTIEVEVEPLGGGDGGREAADQTVVTLEGDTLAVQPPGTDGWTWRRRPRLRIVVRVPAGSSLAAKSAAAPVTVGGTWADVRVHVASAGVTVDRATGDVDLDAASGELTVGRVGGSLRIKSASGRLRVSDVTGDVNAETASGRIRLDNVGGSARAESASGGIEIGRLTRGRADVRTASGDVQVGVAGGAGVWMDLNTASGKTITDLTAHGDVPPAGDHVELELRIRTASGNIRVFRAAPQTAAA